MCRELWASAYRRWSHLWFWSSDDAADAPDHDGKRSEVDGFIGQRWKFGEQAFRAGQACTVCQGPPVEADDRCLFVAAFGKDVEDDSSQCGVELLS